MVGRIACGQPAIKTPAKYVSATAFRTALEDRLPQAIRETFHRRKTHEIPADLPSPPTSWSRPFAEMAAECGLEPDIGKHFSVVTQFFRKLRP